MTAAQKYFRAVYANVFKVILSFDRSPLFLTMFDLLAEILKYIAQ